ncbi:polygalacturonase PglB [Roseibium sp. Sym1]|uniref:polygalacturonase PglB n=1 Tax=Roseibium sp. Sym1 TaxID=3016006 RepID=UPI0022B326E9|nr:glycosyl hydrolase family 28 protein [Roseibium sp. Sym1]
MKTQERHRIDLEAIEGDGTSRLQAALDRARTGPVHVCLGAGRHRLKGVRLWSDTLLELGAGAVLAFQPDYEAYSGTTVNVEAEQSDRAMIVASEAARITICGEGRIECSGAGHFSTGEDERMGTRIPAQFRPRVLVFDKCNEVTLRGISVHDSPMWTLHLVDCIDVTISGARVENDRRMPNTDGLVLDGCENVTVTACEIRTADDGIVLKTSARAGGGTTRDCRNIRISDCVVESRSCALKIGTESHADFADISFEDCVVEASNRALGIFSRDGGSISRVRFARIRLDCFETPDGFWGSGEPLTITALDRRPGIRPAGAVSDIEVRDITGRAPGAINLWAERAGLVSGVTLDGIVLKQNAGEFGTALQYDLRPTPADLDPAPEAAGRANAWRLGADGKVMGLVPYPDGLPGLFARGVRDLNCGSVRIDRPDPLPEGWAPDVSCMCE